MEYYSAMKKNEILTFVTTWMNPKGIMLSEINQRVEDCMISLTYRIQKTKEVRIKRTD